MNIEHKHAIPSAIVRAVGVTLQRKLKTPLVQVGKGELSVSEASKKAYSAFLQAHANARFAGRLAAGDKMPLGEGDREAVALLAEEQQQYFEKFAGQIEAGKYTGEDGVLRESAIEDRAGLYTLRLRGTAADGWAGALDADELIEWQLGGSENNCSICPDLAEQGPYKPGELPTTPGSNETPCLFRCNCSLEAKNSGSSPPKSFAGALSFSPQFLLKHAVWCACS